MNSCVYQKRAFVAGCDDGMKRMEPVVCPKPRRLGLLNPSLNDHNRSSIWSISQQTEICDSEAGAELLDIILNKGDADGERSGRATSSPRFFSGSPPTRASNPLSQDAQFINGKVVPPFPCPASPPPSSPPAVRAGGGCVRMKFGHQPAAVRIEGFNCLSRDGRSCSVSAMA